MASSVRPLGDPHNFNKVVFESSCGRIFKPRASTWERLFLSIDSPLRIFFEETLPFENNPFRLAPALSFEDKKDGFLVSKLSLASTESFSQNELLGIGQVVALCTFFGIGDLHFENIFLGRNQEGKLYFFPLDIESIFDHLSLVSQTLLIPIGEHPKEIGGLSQIRNWVAKSGNLIAPLQLLDGFIQMTQKLNQLKGKIYSKLFSDIQLHSTPIRVIPRATRMYHKLLYEQNPELDIPLYPCESDQLQRSDIPYYFRYLTSEEIFYFDSPNSKKLASFSLEIDQFKLPIPQVLVEKILSASVPDPDLLKNSAVQLVRYFLADINFNELTFASIHVKSRNEMIYLKIGDTTSVKFLKESKSKQ